MRRCEAESIRQLAPHSFPGERAPHICSCETCSLASIQRSLFISIYLLVVLPGDDCKPIILERFPPAPFVDLLVSWSTNMTTEAALPFTRQHLLGGGNRSPSMAALMQSNNEAVTISNPLPGTSTSIISSQPESIAFLKQSRPESLSSIASAGLHISRSGESLSQMPTASPSGQTDRPTERKGSPQASSQVAREALGASEKPEDGPVRGSMSIADQMQVDSHPTDGNGPDTFGTSDNNSTSLVNTSTVASPGPIEDSNSQDGDRSRLRDNGDIPPEASNKAFSYPMPTSNLTESRRGLSLPDSGFHRSGQRSPSTKKHRCPYCSTEFTRHHNLKSHLLTHSQEKPYVCQTCQSRFRRLHDLKRHTKLHTGERPHICPTCGRRFARGDALARHNKGQGGCAGRRASMGSFAAEDDYGDGAPPGGPEDTMEGLVYAEPERMDEEDERRLNMPSIRKPDPPPGEPSRSNTATFQSRQPSTYPPIAASRPPIGGLFPPPTSHGGSSASTSPISQTGNMTFPPAGHPSGVSVLQPSSTAESSKPPSPNAFSSHHLGNGAENIMQIHRAHSPGVTQPFPQHSLGRTGPGPSQSSAPNNPATLPPPQPGAPQLPPPPGMGSPDSRFGLNGQAPVQLSTAPAKHSSSQSHSSNHSGPLPSKAGPDTHGLPGPYDMNYVDQSREDKLWSYIRSVHEELASLKTEVAALRAQLSSSANVPVPPNPSVAQPQATADAPSTEQR